MAPKRPKLNPGILEEIFHEIKIPSGNEKEPEEYPLTAFMLAGKETFNLALNFYNQMKEATIGQKSHNFQYKNEEYAIYREFPLFNLFGQTLLASIEIITCFRNYPKDLPLFKHVKKLKELTADPFYILTYSKSFAQIEFVEILTYHKSFPHIEFVERIELQTNVKDLMNIHQITFSCNELCLKDYGFSRFMENKNLNCVEILTLEDYIDDIEIPNLQFQEIAACFSTKFPTLQRFTIIFIIFIQNNLDLTAQFTEDFVQALSIELPEIQFTINFELYLSCLKQSHVNFYDNIIQDRRYEVNQKEKSAKRIISSGKCKMDILFSFG
uniref:Uncharacterized protein n=1 Tax=Panagrolaimus davidi TaxID=227884 RepID=A0A914Q317_9BILA